MSDGQRIKKKPTIREVSNIVLELNNRINSLMGFLSELERAFSLYVEMKGDNDKFTELINEKVKEYKKQQEKDVSKANGISDKPNLQGDSDGEGSGTEGIREEAR